MPFDALKTKQIFQCKKHCSRHEFNAEKTYKYREKNRE